MIDKILFCINSFAYTGSFKFKFPELCKEYEYFEDCSGYEFCEDELVNTKKTTIKVVGINKAKGRVMVKFVSVNGNPTPNSDTHTYNLFCFWDMFRGVKL